MPDLSVIANSPHRIRQRNELAVLRALHQHRQLSRADLARELRLNRSSSGNIIADLLTDGLVREVEERSRDNNRAGRPGIQLELMPQAVCFLGLEIGVEHISAVGIDLAAQVTRAKLLPFDGRGADVGNAVTQALRLALDGLDEHHLNACEGIGIAVPGQMDSTGKLRLAPLLGWHNIDIAAHARNVLPLPLPVMAENDANAFAIGAGYGQRHGRGRVTLVVNMESGIGAGILIDGTLFRGGRGLAGEIGHLRLAQDGEGAETTLEQRIGLERLLVDYRAHSHRADASLTLLLQDVAEREPGAVRIAEGWARALAFALAQSCRIIDAETVVLGGSVAALYPLVSARVTAHLRAFQEDSFPLPEISVAEGPESGAAFGAACMMHQRFLSQGSHRFAAAGEDAIAAPAAG